MAGEGDFWYTGGMNSKLILLAAAAYLFLKPEKAHGSLSGPHGGGHGGGHGHGGHGHGHGGGGRYRGGWGGGWRGGWGWDYEPRCVYVDPQTKETVITSCSNIVQALS